MEARLARLAAAQELFKRGKEEWSTQACEENYRLIKYQVVVWRLPLLTPWILTLVTLHLAPVTWHLAPVT